MQMILIICGFQICEFDYLLKCIYDPEGDGWGHFWRWADLRWAETRCCSASWFQLLPYASILFIVYLLPHFFLFLFIFWCFVLMMSLLQLPSKHLAEVLSSVAEIRMAVICLLEKIRVLDKLHPGMSQSAIGCEFNVMNKPYILNKVFLNRNVCKTKLCIDQLTKMWPEACRNTTTQCQCMWPGKQIHTRLVLKGDGSWNRACLLFAESLQTERATASFVLCTVRVHLLWILSSEACGQALGAISTSRSHW